MELKDFVSSALIQIVEGVSSAQNEVKEGKINPHFSGITPDEQALREQGLYISRKGETIQNVEFDVAVTVIDDAKTKGSVGIFVGTLGLGSQGESARSNSSLSRIKFVVPLTLPMHKEGS